jgi:hypothetical protein
MINKQILFDLTYQELKDLCLDFQEYLRKNKPKYYNENCKWIGGGSGANVIIIRCNKPYTGNDTLRNNDYLIIVKNNGDSYEQFVYNCTADPKTMRLGIATLLEQCYVGNIRNHHYTPNRPAICQDFCRVWVGRYDGKNGYEQFGYFTMHIHNPAGFFNSSLGCTILSTDDSYISTFRPLLKKLIAEGYTRNIPVFVMQEETFNNLIK